MSAHAFTLPTSAAASVRARIVPSRPPAPRWHRYDHPYLRRRRLRLEALLGSRCAYCGLSRADGVNLHFHHWKGRRWTNSNGGRVSPSQLSWSQRLCRYAADIAAGLVVLACDQTGNNCHEQCRGQEPGNLDQTLYELADEETASGSLAASNKAHPF